MYPDEWEEPYLISHWVSDDPSFKSIGPQGSSQIEATKQKFVICQPSIPFRENILFMASYDASDTQIST